MLCLQQPRREVAVALLLRVLRLGVAALVNGGGAGIGLQQQVCN